jgi:hypothetical protein
MQLIQRIRAPRALIALVAVVIGSLLQSSLATVDAGGVGTASIARHVAAQESRACRMAFEVSLYDGPSAPFSLAGALALRIEPSGAVTGELTPDVVSVDGSDLSPVLPSLPVPVAGQVNGRSVNLVFQVAEDKYVFGSGTSTTDLSDCNGPIDGSIGGAAVGPEAGDRGDWLGSYCVLVPNPFGGLFSLCLPG